MTFAAYPGDRFRRYRRACSFLPTLIATLFTVGFILSIFEGIIWNGNLICDWLEASLVGLRVPWLRRFCSSSRRRWLDCLVAVYFLGCVKVESSVGKHYPTSRHQHPILALGLWSYVSVGLAFNVMSAQAINGISGLVAMNIMAMVGGILGGSNCR